MAIIKHFSSKNADYGAAEKYLMFVHDEHTQKEVRDASGHLIPRENIRFAMLGCMGDGFAVACMKANRRYGKNNKRSDIKSHHYIISFDPRDKDDHGLTVDRAQELGVQYCKENFPGHQAIVATHPDGHHGAGNIHVHIVINSLRVNDVERKVYMDRRCDTMAGAKHRCTGAALRHFRSEVMEMCHREGLYQIDLLNGSKVRITDREYHAARRGQKELDAQNARLEANGIPVIQTKYETEKETLRRVIREAMEKANDLYELQRILSRDYGITVKESRGRFSYLTPGRKKPITSRMLGTDFGKESIEVYFASGKQKENVPVQTEQKIFVPRREPAVARVIDIEAKKAEGKGIGYEKWAGLFNLKQRAAALAFIQERGIQTMADLDEAVKTLSSERYDALHAVKDKETEIREAKELADWCVKYRENQPICAKIKECRTKEEKDQFRNNHNGNFILRDAAVRHFKEHGIKKLPSAEKLEERIQRLISEKNGLYNEYREKDALLNDLQNAQINLKSMFEQEQTVTQKKRRTHEESL